MNRSRKAIIAVIGLIGLFALFYYLVEASRYPGKVSVDPVSDAQDFTLQAEAGSSQIFAIELQFEGELSGDAVITIGLPGNPYYIRKTLKAGEIDTKYEGDWYYEQCPIRYEPKEQQMEGYLDIRYRFIRN